MTGKTLDTLIKDIEGLFDGSWEETEHYTDDNLDDMCEAIRNAVRPR